MNQSDQKNAMQETERQIRAAVDSYVSNNSADPGNLTRIQMVDLVKSFDNIPNFSKYYGGSQSIIERFPIKELKPTCAPGDTTC